MTGVKRLEGSDGRSVEELIQLEATHRTDSIVFAIEAALMEKDQLSEAEQVILVVEAMEREVNNGGFEQFFVSASVEHASTLVSALEQIGAPKIAEIADRAAGALGAEPDWPPERYEVAASKADDFTVAALSECDHAYHSSGEAICELLFEYIKANRTDIDLSAE